MSEVKKLRDELVRLGVERVELNAAVIANVQEIRVAALRALVVGLSPGQVAELTGLNSATVRRWRGVAKAKSKHDSV